MSFHTPCTLFKDAVQQHRQSYSGDVELALHMPFHRVYIMIGVAPIDFDIYKDDFHNGWYLSCYNSTLCSGPPYNYSDFQCKLGPVNNEVIVIMNTIEKTLKFWVDDKDVGPQYTDRPTDKLLSPAVILYSQNAPLEIVEC